MSLMSTIISEKTQTLTESSKSSWHMSPRAAYTHFLPQAKSWWAFKKRNERVTPQQESELNWLVDESYAMAGITFKKPSGAVARFNEPGLDSMQDKTKANKEYIARVIEWVGRSMKLAAELSTSISKVRKASASINKLQSNFIKIAAEAQSEANKLGKTDLDKLLRGTDDEEIKKSFTQLSNRFLKLMLVNLKSQIPTLKQRIDNLVANDDRDLQEQILQGSSFLQSISSISSEELEGNLEMEGQTEDEFKSMVSSVKELANEELSKFTKVKERYEAWSGQNNVTLGYLLAFLLYGDEKLYVQACSNAISASLVQLAKESEEARSLMRLPNIVEKTAFEKVVAILGNGYQTGQTGSLCDTFFVMKIPGFKVNSEEDFDFPIPVSLKAIGYNMSKGNSVRPNNGPLSKVPDPTFTGAKEGSKKKTASPEEEKGDKGARNLVYWLLQIAMTNVTNVKSRVLGLKKYLPLEHHKTVEDISRGVPSSRLAIPQYLGTKIFLSDLSRYLEPAGRFSKATRQISIVNLLFPDVLGQIFSTTPATSLTTLLSTEADHSFSSAKIPEIPVSMVKEILRAYGAYILDYKEAIAGIMMVSKPVAEGTQSTIISYSDLLDSVEYVHLGLPKGEKGGEGDVKAQTEEDFQKIEDAAARYFMTSGTLPSYKFMKAIKDSRTGKTLFQQVAYLTGGSNLWISSTEIAERVEGDKNKENWFTVKGPCPFDYLISAVLDAKRTGCLFDALPEDLKQDIKKIKMDELSEPAEA